MKTMLIRSNVPQVAVKAIDPAIELAYGFLSSRYGNRFNDVTLIFSHEVRSKYYQQKKTAKIGITTKWWTYEKKTVGVAARGLKPGYILGTAIAIVHELTHHIQHLENRKASEVETTKNEIEFMSLVDPEWNKFLITI